MSILFSNEITPGSHGMSYPIAGMVKTFQAKDDRTDHPIVVSTLIKNTSSVVPCQLKRIYVYHERVICNVKRGSFFQLDFMIYDLNEYVDCLAYGHAFSAQTY